VRQFLKSFKQCGTSNSLDGPEADKLIEESETSDDVSVILSRTVVMSILGDSVTIAEIIYCPAILLSNYL